MRSHTITYTKPKKKLAIVDFPYPTRGWGHGWFCGPLECSPRRESTPKPSRSRLGLSLAEQQARQPGPPARGRPRGYCPEGPAVWRHQTTSTSETAAHPVKGELSSAGAEEWLFQPWTYLGYGMPSPRSEKCPQETPRVGGNPTLFVSRGLFVSREVADSRQKREGGVPWFLSSGSVLYRGVTHH